jgi:hypothetical protein
MWFRVSDALFVHQNFAEIGIFVRPDSGLEERQLVPEDGSRFVAQAELLRVQMRDENGLRLVEPEHAVNRKYTCLFGQEHELGELHLPHAINEIRVELWFLPSVPTLMRQFSWS